MQIAVKQLEGRDHYVVPMVMITVGVHAGSQGPVYYPPDELRTSVPFWNAKPIVVYHPDLIGLSWAGSPAVYNQQKIGTVFNTQFDGHRLSADAWIDVARVAAVDPRVEQTIKQRRMMEVSTGVSFDFGMGTGVWNGRQYHTTARRLTPDHLAVLPDRCGACSIADGAGLVRNLNATTAPHAASNNYGGLPGHNYTPGSHAATAAVCNDESPLVMGKWTF